MVSLLKLAEITEEGVTFDNPFENDMEGKKGEENNNKDGGGGDGATNANGKRESASSASDETATSESQRMLLRPEDSIHHQNNIGSDIIMALDDVVSSVSDDNTRFKIATYRTVS